MMNLSYTKNGIVFNPIKSWELSDGGYIAIYQGNRGYNPELDYIVKYKKPTSRLRAPSHTHWIVDLILKCEYDSEEVGRFVREWLEIYDLVEPFSSVEERNNYELIYHDYFSDSFYSLDNLGAFKIDFVSAMIELFIKCEKQTPGAFMFKNLLLLVNDYCIGKKDFYQVISYSKRV
jgi:hypothetical protein